MQEIKAINSYFGFEYEIFYWHTRNHIEVDLILYGPRGFLAIEVKATQRIRPSHFDGLEEFRSDYPEAVPLVFYLGQDRKNFEGVEILPAEFFLTNLVGILKKGTLEEMV